MLRLSHKRLTVYQKSLLLTKIIYKLTGKFPKSELYTLTSQLRRAAISVSSNIAEGSSRTSSKEKIRFYEIARSSLVEIDSQIEVAILLEYLQDSDCAEMDELINVLFAMLTRLMKSVR